jgi:RES domain-containing protein
LAVLEALVHLSPTNLPDDFCMVMLDVPDNIAEVKVNILPPDWSAYPEQNILKQIGNTFLQEKKYLLLKVPSALVKEEYNYLLNPFHTKATSVKIISKQPFNFDERLIGH